jgi:hypothetical protein
VANLRRIAITVGCAGTLATAAACGSSHGQTHTQRPTQIERQADAVGWSGLTRVSVDVDQPSVAPIPGVKNTPSRFTSPAQLRTVRNALNANHIRKAGHTTTDDGCTGGIEIAIKITQRQGGRTDLSAYDCANRITGNIAGNLTGFLKQIDVAIP